MPPRLDVEWVLLYALLCASKDGLGFFITHLLGKALDIGLCLVDSLEEFLEHDIRCFDVPRLVGIGRIWAGRQRTGRLLLQ